MSKTENITANIVNRIAALGRIALTEPEKQDMAQKLADILGHFSAIQKIDTHHVPTADNLTGLTNATRADKVEKEKLCTPPALLDAAPETKQGHVKVPGVFE